MEKINCWEFKKCGREPGGERVNELGACVAATHKSLDGVNGGINGGRLCWTVAGTYGIAKLDNIECNSAHEISSCFECEFHDRVLVEEGFLSIIKV
jgi:hypothetical protein